MQTLNVYKENIFPYSSKPYR